MPRMRPIPSTCGLYLAGDDGHIYRRGHAAADGRAVPRRRVAEGLYGSAARKADRGAYLRARTCVHGVQAERAVHRLVAEAWLPDFHWLLEVHHVNGDVTDNRPCNLACLTRAEHERAHGLPVRGCDLVNARHDFELHRGDPPPNPYSRMRATAAKRAANRARAAARRGRSDAEGAAREIRSLIRSAEGLAKGAGL